MRRRGPAAARARSRSAGQLPLGREVRDGLLLPKSAEEVAATQGVAVAATGAGPIGTDALVQGVDQPIERR